MPRPTSQSTPLPLGSPPRQKRESRPSPKAGASERRRQAAAQVSGLVPCKPPARLKLEALEKERSRLLREIERNKAHYEATEQVSRDAHDALHFETEGLHTRLGTALRELHQIFAALLSPKSRIGRAERAELRRFYRQVLGGLPHPDAFDASSEEPPTRAPEGESPSPFEGAGTNPAREHASAHKPSESNTSLLRALYKKLAVALHPDRAQHPSESARLTSVMKEVTRAYAEEDLAKLVEIERNWLVPSPERDEVAELELRVAALVEANRELRRQLRALGLRLRELEEALPGVSRRGPHPACAAEIAARTRQALERELTDLERLRDDARDLSEGRSSVFEFLMGPRSPAAPAEPLEASLEAMLEELLGAAVQRARADARRRPRRR